MPWVFDTHATQFEALSCFPRYTVRVGLGVHLRSSSQLGDCGRSVWPLWPLYVKVGNRQPRAVRLGLRVSVIMSV